MKTYTLPRNVFDILVDTFKDKQKAENFANAIEEIVDISVKRAEEEIIEKKELVKIEIKEELKNELVTRDLFEERFKVVDERFKSIEAKFENVDERFKTLDFKINILIALTMIALTFANPTFVNLIKEIFKG